MGMGATFFFTITGGLAGAMILGTTGGVIGCAAGWFFGESIVDG